MAITITKFGNQAQVVKTGETKSNYYDALAIANSFSLNTGISPFTVSSRIISNWDVTTPLSEITIIAGSTYSGMVTAADWGAALADLSKLTTN